MLVKSVLKQLHAARFGINGIDDSVVRQVRREQAWRPLQVSAADPVNYTGILTPTERVPASAKRDIVIP